MSTPLVKRAPWGRCPGREHGQAETYISSGAELQCTADVFLPEPAPRILHSMMNNLDGDVRYLPPGMAQGIDAAASNVGILADVWQADDPRRHKCTFCRSLKPGQAVNDFFLVLKVWEKQGRRGGSYLVLTLCDRTGPLCAFVGRPTHPLLPGHVIRVHGSTRQRHGQLELIVQSAIPVPSSPGLLASLIPSAPEPSSHYLQRLTKVTEAVSDPGHQGFIRGFLGDTAFLTRFCRAPASLEHHHAYEGGLLQHTVEVMESALRISPGLPRPLDLSLLLTLAFTHDIGKIDAYTATFPYRLTSLGRAWGHEILGLQRVFQTLTTHPVLSPAASGRLLTALLEAHRPAGRPAMPEIIVLKALDGLDAGLAHAQSIRGSEPSGLAQVG
jgi:3'-5' exoribonuclease